MTIEERNTARAIQDIAKEMKSIRKESDRIKIIDWEQRRYEIAKDMLAAFLSNSCTNVYAGTPEEHAIDAVQYADALIEKLKEWKE